MLIGRVHSAGIFLFGRRMSHPERLFRENVIWSILEIIVELAHLTDEVMAPVGWTLMSSQTS